MSGLDESLVLDSLHLEIDLQREAIHLGSLAQNDRGMDLCLGGSVPLASRAGHELEGAQKAGWKRGQRARDLPPPGSDRDRDSQAYPMAKSCSGF